MSRKFGGMTLVPICHNLAVLALNLGKQKDEHCGLHLLIHQKVYSKQMTLSVLGFSGNSDVSILGSERLRRTEATKRQLRVTDFQSIHRGQDAITAAA
jgi:hypothetical protein